MSSLSSSRSSVGSPPILSRRTDDSLFSATWYRRRYGDVDVLNVDPLQHFLTWGRLLERSPGPDFDTRFYLSRYGDVGSENPLRHYQSLPESDNRPVTPAQLQAEMDALTREMDALWQPERLMSPCVVPPVVSYCIPLLGRLDDIRGTLAET